MGKEAVGQGMRLHAHGLVFKTLTIYSEALRTPDNSGEEIGDFRLSGHASQFS